MTQNRKQDLWQWRHHLFELILYIFLIFMWLKLLDKRLHPMKSGIWGWIPVDSHSFCTHWRAPSHGQRCGFRNRKSPESASSLLLDVLCSGLDFKMAAEWLNRKRTSGGRTLSVVVVLSQLLQLPAQMGRLIHALLLSNLQQHVLLHQLLQPAPLAVPLLNTNTVTVMRKPYIIYQCCQLNA